MSDTLKKKYIKSLDLFEEMNQESPLNRPNCDLILKNKNDWALFEHEFSYDESSAILNSNYREDDIIHFILREKFNYHNEP